MKKLLPASFAFVFLLVSSVAAPQTGVPPGSVTDLPTISVAASKSPPMWLFSKGGKKLVVLGTQVPLPRDGIVVKSEIDAYVRRSQAVLTGPGLRTGEDVGLFAGMMMLGSMRKAMRNPGDRTLSEVVPPDEYRRWLSLKAKYLGNDRGVEKLRPMYAAFKLYGAALKHSDLTETSKVGPIIVQSAEAIGLQREDARYNLPSHDLKATLKAFDVEPARDLACFTSTLEQLESYMQFAPAAADAWAVGDMVRYKLAEDGYVPLDGCWARLTNASIARSAGVSDPYKAVDATWLAAVRRALAQHDVVFSTLPARDLVYQSGLAAALRAEGYEMTPLFGGQG